MSTRTYRKVVKKRSRAAKKARTLPHVGVRAAAKATGCSKSTVHRLRKDPKKVTLTEKTRCQISVILEAMQQLRRKYKVRKNIGYETVRDYVETHLKTCGKIKLASMKEFPGKSRYYVLLKQIPLPRSKRVRGIRRRRRKFCTDPASIKWYGLSPREFHFMDKGRR